VLPLVYVLVLLPITVLDVRHASGRATFDQSLFHEPTIRAASESWPVVELTYPKHYVAMTPGYHWAFGGVRLLTGLEAPGLRVVWLVVSGVILCGFTLVLARRAGVWLGVALSVPLYMSLYVVSSSAWLLADNAGWAWVLALSLLALRIPWSWRVGVLAGLGLLAAFWTRQNLLWLALPLWAAAWMGPWRGRSGGLDDPGAHPLASFRRRAVALLPMAAATIPALVSLWYVYSVWGGLVPHEFQGQYASYNLSNIPLQFAMLAALGPFFLPALVGVGEAGWRERIARTLARCRPWAIGAAVAVAAFSSAVPTNYEPKAGRAGMVWIIGSKLNALSPAPDFFSPLLVVGAAVGAAVLVCAIACAPGRQRWVLGAIFAGFGVAQAASYVAWQRYHDPFALLFMGLLTATAVAARERRPARPPLIQVVPLVLLAVALAVVTVATLWQREIGPWQAGAPAMPSSSDLPPPPGSVSEGQ